MKSFFFTILALFIGFNTVFAQSADPSITGANFVPNQINTGQTSVLTVSFANTGSSDIPKNSIEVTVSTAFSFYTTNGTSIPTGVGANLFNWTYSGVVGSSDVWKGKNKEAIAAYDGGDILFTVTGNTASGGYETTNINVQPTDSLSKFNDSQVNNNLQPQLKINQGCPPAPLLVGGASTKGNVCPLTTADLTTLQPTAVSGQTFEWHTVASNPTTLTFVSSPSQVAAGTYYLYAKGLCYSPASQAVTVTITTCTSSDLLISVGQPSPAPIVGQTSLIPVTASNLGTASTSGMITAVVKIPVGTTFGIFPTLNNGWTCSAAGTTATCTSSAVIAPLGTSLFNVPFIPATIQVGNPLIVPPAKISGGGEKDSTNNYSSIVTTPNVVGSDLTPNFTAGSTTFTVGTSKTVVININEVGNVITNGTYVSVFIPYSTGFTYAFTSIETSVTVIGTELVNNPDWFMTIKPAGLLLRSLVPIPANGRSRIAITVTATTLGAEANLTANITPFGGGETNAFNNIISLDQSVQN